MTLTDALIALLTAAGVDAYDGPPPTVPGGTGPRYVSLSVPPGVPSDERLAAPQPNYRTTLTMMCVARTRPGLRALVATVRGALEHQRIGGFLLTERLDTRAPVLTDGPADDVRHSVTLYLTITTPRSLL